MRVDLDDEEDWIRVGRPAPAGRGFGASRLFLARAARRGAGVRAALPAGAPRFVLGLGYTQRHGIGADSRTRQRTLLRAQATYNGLDGKMGGAFSFDADGTVVRDVWERVESWQDDRRYWRASLNPFDHAEIRDWERFGHEFMATLQHGAARTFDPTGAGLHWGYDGLLTDADRAAGRSLDWVASVHRETGRTHAHVLIGGTLGGDDLYVEPGAVKDLWQVGRGVASMDHHVGLGLERERALEPGLMADIRRSLAVEDRDVRAVGRDLGLDLPPARAAFRTRELGMEMD